MGFAVSWTMLFSYPLMAVIQEISGRIGRVTGRGIAGNIRKHYPNWLLQIIVLLLLIANTINIGADLGAMGEAVGLLIGGPHLLYVILFGGVCASPSDCHAIHALRLHPQMADVGALCLFRDLMVVKVPWGEVVWGLFVPLFRPMPRVSGPQ